jgi:hypothetical protein
MLGSKRAEKQPSTEESTMFQFSPETIQHLRAVLDDASAEIHADSPIKALMAEHILRTAATGVRGYEKLREAAVEIARCEAA